MKVVLVREKRNAHSENVSLHCAMATRFHAPRIKVRHRSHYFVTQKGLSIIDVLFFRVLSLSKSVPQTCVLFLEIDHK